MGVVKSFLHKVKKHTFQTTPGQTHLGPGSFPELGFEHKSPNSKAVLFPLIIIQLPLYSDSKPQFEIEQSIIVIER